MITPNSVLFSAACALMIANTVFGHRSSLQLNFPPPNALAAQFRRSDLFNSNNQESSSSPIQSAGLSQSARFLPLTSSSSSLSSANNQAQSYVCSSNQQQEQQLASGSQLSRRSLSVTSTQQLSQLNSASSQNSLSEELMKQKQHIQYHLWPSVEGKCHKRTLNFCASVLPFNTTTFPNIIGDTNRFEVKRSMPFFGFLAKSSCNKRLDELLCLLLEPPCSNRSGLAIPPCKKFCRLALEGCNEYIPATLAMSSVFDCRQYPESNDPNVCINLAQGSKCAPDEFKCPDKTCIPRNWLCDGVRDCIFAADEANCTAPTGVGLQSSVCSTEEFKCDGKCVPKAWKCDGERDCMDGTDEESCDMRPRCAPDRFKCADGNGCLPKRWVCDGKAECRDGSDELNCEQLECSENDFKCDNGICIPKLWRCDRQYDCKDGSDEKSCLYPTTSTTTSTTTTLAPQTSIGLADESSSHSNGSQLVLSAADSFEEAAQLAQSASSNVEQKQVINEQVSSSSIIHQKNENEKHQQQQLHSLYPTVEQVGQQQQQQQLLMSNSPMNYYASGNSEQSAASRQQLESSLNDDISRIIQQESSSSPSAAAFSSSSVPLTSSPSSFSSSSSSSSVAANEVATEPATQAESASDLQQATSTLIPVTDNQHQRQHQQQPIAQKEMKKFNYDIIQSVSSQANLMQLNELSGEQQQQPQPANVGANQQASKQQQLVQTQIDFVPQNSPRQVTSAGSESDQQQELLAHQPRTQRGGNQANFGQVIKSSSLAPQNIQASENQHQQFQSVAVGTVPTIERVPIYRSLFKTLKGGSNRVPAVPSDGSQAATQPHRYSIVARRRRDRHHHNQQQQQQRQQQYLQQQQHQPNLPLQLDASNYWMPSSLAPPVTRASAEQQATLVPSLRQQNQQAINQTTNNTPSRQSHHQSHASSVGSYLQLLNNRYNLRMARISPTPTNLTP